MKYNNLDLTITEDEVLTAMADERLELTEEKIRETAKKIKKYIEEASEDLKHLPEDKIETAAEFYIERIVDKLPPEDFITFLYQYRKLLEQVKNLQRGDKNEGFLC